MTDLERSQPPCRTDFQIAIICALRIESDAVEALFDQKWDAVKIGKAQRDPNSYAAGRIGQHNVILAFMPGIGKARSASVAATLRASFVNISLALVVGICGGSPVTAEGDRILLGDVIISNRVVQSDFGRQFSDSLRIKDTLTDSLARPSHDISSFLAKMSGIQAGQEMKDRSLQYLYSILQTKGFEGWQYPGLEEDKLYRSEYRHKHYPPRQCALCSQCVDESYPVCDVALDAACEELGCTNKMLIYRDAVARNNIPSIYQGVFASSDQTIRSAYHREKLLQSHKAIGFEMEGAGVWDSLPTIIVKGVCDYADSHKNKSWQKYAAATAAAVTKALLAEWISADETSALLQHNATDAAGTYEMPLNPNDSPLSHNFIGRNDELLEISQALSPGYQNGTGSQKLFVIYGAGGIGKTQIAAAFAHTNRHRFSAVIWIDGSTSDSAKRSLSSFAAKVRPNRGGDSSNADEDVQNALAWLAQADNTDWLMIFDNVDLDIDARPPDPQAYRVQGFFPSAHHGSILITSRLQSMYRLGKSRKIARFSSPESVRLFEQHFGRPVVGDKDAEAVIESLDGLPLALAMAASFIRETATTFKAYHMHYENTWSDLLEQQDEYPLQEYMQRPILATWRLSYAEVQRQSADAVQLLKLLSFFNNTGLNQKILTVACKPDLLEDQDTSWYARICRSSLSFARPLRLLLRYSLIEQEGANDELMIHSVLHEWVHNLVVKESEHEYKTVCKLAGHLIAQQIPSNELDTSYWPKMRTLVPHANAFSRRLQMAKERIEVPISDLLRIGSLLRSCAFLFYAEHVYLEAVRFYEKTHAPDHTSTLTAVNDLGLLYHDQGKLDAAEQMLERALQGREKALGPDHTSTLTAVNDLGLLYRDQGKLDAAEQMLVRALQGKEKALGPDHTSTLTIVNNLGLLYRDQGKLDAAEQMLVRALQGYEKALGPDHMLTLTVVHNLGLLYRDQDKPDAVEQMLVRALQGREKALGPDHTSTLTVVTNLGLLYRDQGKLDAAEQMLVRALQGYEKALGPDHTLTLNAVNDLGLLYHDQGKLDAAEQMFIRALQGKEKALGPDHTLSLQIDTILKDIRVEIHEA